MRTHTLTHIIRWFTLRILLHIHTRIIYMNVTDQVKYVCLTNLKTNIKIFFSPLNLIFWWTCSLNERKKKKKNGMSLTSGGGSLRGRGVTSDFFYTETLRQTGGQNRNYRKEERNYKTQPKIRVGDSFFFFFSFQRTWRRNVLVGEGKNHVRERL